VQFFHLDAEVADHPKAEGGHEAGPVGQEQLVERSPDPVVVQATGLLGTEAECCRVVSPSPGPST